MEAKQIKESALNKSMNELKLMTDEEIVKNYIAIKEERNLVDVYYLTEIMQRNLLHHINA